MAAKRRGGYTPPTSAEQRAMRDAKLQPAVQLSEAEKRERSFLKGINAAGDDLEWLLLNKGWLQLGFDHVGEWWQQRVLPVLVHLDVRPSVPLAMRFIEVIAEDEASLPKAQRHNQRAIASMARVSQATVSRALADAAESESDLEETSGATAAAPADPPAGDSLSARHAVPRPGTSTESTESTVGTSDSGPVLAEGVSEDGTGSAAAETGPRSSVRPADGGEGAKDTPEDPPAPASVPSAVGDGAGVTPKIFAGDVTVPVVSQQPGPDSPQAGGHIRTAVRLGSMPSCVTAEPAPPADFEVRCPGCVQWFLSGEGRAWRDARDADSPAGRLGIQGHPLLVAGEAPEAGERAGAGVTPPAADLAEGTAGDAPEGTDPADPVPSGDPDFEVWVWTDELRRLVARRPMPAAVADAEQLVLDVLYEALADLEEWHQEIDETRHALAQIRST